MKQKTAQAFDLSAIALLPQFQDLLRKQHADKLAAEERDRCACLDELAALESKKKMAEAQLDKENQGLQEILETLQRKRQQVGTAERACIELASRWQNASQRLSMDHGEGHLSTALMRMHTAIELQRRVVASFEGLIYQRTPWGTMREDAKKKTEHTAAFQRLADLHAIDDQLRSLVRKRCAPTQLVAEVDALMEKAGLGMDKSESEEQAAA
ncbi:hypothetical protein ACFQNJ_03610 [Hydrogenophaga bisanensis]|uniref:Uncharacterized protein n=1 Tax=Hydrogenophaga bisanensis TaxID=439611 RepID=A0ABW2R553_9BURK